MLCCLDDVQINVLSKADGNSCMKERRENYRNTDFIWSLWAMDVHPKLESSFAGTAFYKAMLLLMVEVRTSKEKLILLVAYGWRSRES